MQLPSTEWRRIIPLVIIMAVVAMTIGGISLYVLYETAFDQAKSRLTETAKSRARLMESVARFNTEHNKYYPGGPFNAALDQIREAHDNFPGFGQTGEFALAKRDNEQIVFVLSHRHDTLDRPNPVPFHKELNNVDLAEPMRRALFGQSGTVVGLDYRGTVVLAAHEPVDVLDLGIVAKIDLSEIRQPFIEAGQILFIISMFIIGLGTVVFFRVSEPMVEKIMETEALRVSQEQLLKAQEITREKAIYLDNILSSALDTSIVATDEKFLVRYFNPTAQKLFGYSPDQVIGRSVQEIHELENVENDRFEKGLANINNNGGHVYQIERADKDSKVIVESRASGIIDENGNRVGYVLMSKDITERKKAEDALIKSERKYRLLMEYANDAIFVADSQTGIIIDANKAASTILGWSMKEIIGMHQTQLHPPEKADLYKKLFEEHVRSGSGVLTNVVILHRDGRHIPVEIRAGVTDLGDKKVIQGLFRDITERKKAEDAIQESRSRLAKAQEIAHLGNWDWDIVNNTLYWSDEIYRIFGLGLTKIRATYELFLESIHPEDRDLVTKAIERSLKNHDIPYDVQHRVVLADGSIKIVREQGEIIRNGQGEPLRMLGTVQDITELKETEEKLRDLNANLENRVKQRTFQLEAANKELEAFSYSVAHDLRAPLNNAMGFAKILLDEYQTKLGENGAEHLQWLNRSTLQMKKRIEDYLQLARSTRVTLNLQEIDLSAIFEKAVVSAKKVNSNFEKTAVNITPGLTVRGDPDLLTVVAENLISNGLKYSEKATNPTLAFGVNVSGKNREFYIKDNGVGFDMKYADRLFEPFERLHEPGTYEGSGIGLTTVQRIVHRHGGEVRVESTIDKGTTFYFTLNIL
ncbi:MAG: PAS domain S-box protein [Magnetococcales bacterium]|nr:PAS domain S-box protein [Magnetococcales bacterium]